MDLNFAGGPAPAHGFDYYYFAGVSWWPALRDHGLSAGEDEEVQDRGPGEEQAGENGPDHAMPCRTAQGRQSASPSDAVSECSASTQPTSTSCSDEHPQESHTRTSCGTGSAAGRAEARHSAHAAIECLHPTPRLW